MKEPRPVKSVFLVGDGERPDVADASRRVVELIDGRVEVRGLELVRESSLAEVEADLVVVLGGDGAILAAARRLADNPATVLGVNFGKLGFLAALRAQELERAVEEVIVGGRFRVTERMVLECTLEHPDGRREGPFHALNDTVVERWDARSLEVEFLVDGVLATTYRGDGVIVATPTGSTAHSLAAGGPIVEPGVDGLVVSPICAHSVANRPLLLRPDRVVGLRVSSGSEKPGLAVDGQVLRPLEHGALVEVRRSERTFRLAVPADRTFFDVLRKRLHWAGQPPETET